ncbi:MAG TPA: glycoside hydrolase family 3 C-terminal domain-containing protein [Armatimonadota bacterium]|jgi:beta-glucosidase
MNIRVRVRRLIIPAFLLAALPALAQEASMMPFRDPNLPISARADDLISRLTLEEKAAQMENNAPAIARLGIPHYDWWNEALHGVARAGHATVFPQAIGLAATWDTDLHHRVATVISDEARAKYSDAQKKGNTDGYYGLTFWSPNINIFRDPRWGRGQETYGEDPFLTSRMGVAFVTGMQGDDPKYLKTVSTSKHFAVHSGPESLRHSFDAVVSDSDLFNTYLPAFEATVREGKAFSVMSAYNRTDGVPCTASKRLLTDILRDQWGFNGYVVSDCDAVSDVYRGHKTVKTAAEAAAISVLAGTELNCGGTYRQLPEAVKQGLISEKQIDAALKRLLIARFRLGMFDPPELVPFNSIPFSVNDSSEHDALALQTARESIVLLKNAKQSLPLKKDLKRLLVVGPNADDVEVMLGNYNGDPSHPITLLKGIKDKLAGKAEVTYFKGSELAADSPTKADALAEAAKSDAVVMVMGISPRLEGEEMDVKVPGFSGGDRTNIDLPKAQEDFIEAMTATGKPVVLVLLSGSALAVNWANDRIPAIVQAWYPGQHGDAVADVLFGDYNPAGRLPVTFYKSVEDLPPFTDYNMAGRTYRYFGGKVLYPFGHGLSYTSFKYGKPKTSISTDSVDLSLDVTNTGRTDGDEVVQVYVHQVGAPKDRPIKQLKAFRRVHIAAGQKVNAQFTLKDDAFAWYDETVGKFVVTPGRYEIQIGTSSADIRQRATVER